ncbi:hypothetical protein RIF29_31803 [Crotalaria pallida]|uniref:Uncharacterized protein n=1 Tax=Crotalaria pallida TaxID=3830 RepID=A0AAN9HVG5_CROPI
MEASRDPKQEREEVKLKLIGGEEVMEELQGCKTPTAKSNKIPEIQTCPPAPRKRRFASSHMKRSSATELSLLIRNEEVEFLFQSLFQLPSRVTKRCKSI